VRKDLAQKTDEGLENTSNESGLGAEECEMPTKTSGLKKEGKRHEPFKFTAEMIGSEILERFSKDIYNPKAIVRELVSNAHDSYAQLEQYLTEIGEELDTIPEVRVDVADNSIIISDAGLGMNREDIDKLVSIALTDKREMSGVRGYRGIGFWSAYTGGEQVVVETTSLGDDRLYRLILNTKSMRERQTPNTSIGSIMNDPECVRLESEPAEPEQHGTKVIIIAETPEGRLYPLVNDPEQMRSVLLQGCACRIPESDEAVQQTPVYKSAAAFTNAIGIKLPRLVFQGTELYKTYPGNLDGFNTEVIDIEVGGNRVELAKLWYATNQENERLDGPAAGIRVMRDGFPIGKPNLDSDRAEIIGSKVEVTRQDLLSWHVGEVHLLHPELRPDASGETLPESVLYTLFRERLRGIYTKLIERSYAKQRTKSLCSDYKKDAAFLATLLTKISTDSTSLSPDEVQRARVIEKKVDNDKKLAVGPLPQGTSPSDKKAYVRDDQASKLRRQLSSTLKKVVPALPGTGEQSTSAPGRKKTKPKAEPEPAAEAGVTGAAPDMTLFLSLIDEIRDAVVEVLKDDETLQTELLTRINQIVSTL
jgi:hypothetical protein